MRLETYGYCINDNIEFRISTSQLMNIQTGKIMRLRPTMARLLNFFLSNERNTIIHDKDVMKHVFDDYGLRSSTQALWQTQKGLIYKLEDIGVKSEFIFRVNHCGFIIDNQYLKRLYSPI